MKAASLQRKNGGRWSTPMSWCAKGTWIQEKLRANRNWRSSRNGFHKLPADDFVERNPGNEPAHVSKSIGYRKHSASGQRPCEPSIGDIQSFGRRGVRVVEGARLESVCRGNLTEGSNPSLSATPNRLHNGIGSIQARLISSP